MSWMRFGSFLIVLLSSFGVFSQSFSGTVLDQETKAPIPFAKVFFIELKTGTSCDENGVFQIKNIKQRTLRVQISSLGYAIYEESINLTATNERTFYLEPSHFNLEEALISATSGRLQGENIVSVEHKSISEIQQNSPLTLAEALSTIPGIDQTTTGAGIGKPVIRGLSGNRIVTYAQGIRIENQQWGDEHGLGVGDVGIESVEIIKGPASLLYGSDALGGVLYFTDERYADQNSIEAFASSKFHSNTLGTVNNLGFKIHRGQLKFNLFGTYSSHADYQTPNLDRVFNTRFDENNIKASLGYNRANWIANLRYSYLKNSFGIVEDADFDSSTERNFILPFQSIDNHNLSLENSYFIGESKLNLTLGYTNNYRKEFEDSEEIPALGLKLETYTYNLKYYSPQFNEHIDFLVGVQGMNQSNKNSGEELLIPNANTTDIGGFTILNLNFEKLEFQGGIRADMRAIDSRLTESEELSIPEFKKNYRGLTYSGGLLYKLNRNKFRANISSGYRAPNTSELLSDGIHEGTFQYVRGNTKLVNENANQLDFSYDFQGEHLDLSFNTFYNSIQNYIFLSPTAENIDDTPVFEYLQTDAVLYGGEFGWHYHPHSIHWLHLESNLSTVLAEDQDGNNLPLIPQSRINTTISAEINQSGKFQLKSLFIQHIFKMRQDNTAENEIASRDYQLLNCGLTAEITTKNSPIELNAGVKNALNRDYIDHLNRFKSLGIPNQGINFYFGIRISIEKSMKQK